MTQNLEIIPQLLRLPDVLKVFPIGKSTWLAGVAEGKYPKPIKITDRLVAWKAAEIQALVQRYLD